MNFLRQSVVVERSPASVALAHAFWSITLPEEWVQNTESMTEFLQRKVPASSVPQDDPEAQSVIFLLATMKCLTAAKKPTFSLREVINLFEPLCVTWHAAYYSHPIWDRLRSGTVTKNAMVAWVLHNYHLSRSAGVTAARCAAYCPRKDIRRLFLSSAIEEYAHCEQYYIVNDDRLGVNREQVVRAVHSKASLKFDQQMMRLAEEDWLAHVLVGYFQEATAAYYDQCCRFYEVIEANYGLSGFFDGWKAHIRLDNEYGHAGEFARALDSDETVPLCQVERAFHNAAITVQSLVAALDEIISAERDDGRVVLRQPLQPSEIHASGSNALVPNRREMNEDLRLELCGTTKELLSEIVRKSDLDGGRCTAPSREEASFIEGDFALSLSRGLSYCRRHDEIVRMGCLVEVYEACLAAGSRTPMNYAPSSWSSGIANFLREMSLEPRTFVFVAELVRVVLARHSAAFPVFCSEKVRELLSTSTESSQISGSEIYDMATVALQCLELLDTVVEPSIRRISVDVFL